MYFIPKMHHYIIPSCTYIFTNFLWGQDPIIGKGQAPSPYSCPLVRVCAVPLFKSFRGRWAKQFC